MPARRRLIRRAWANGPLALGILLAFGCRPDSSENVHRLDSDYFSHVEIWGTRGTALGQFNKPRSLALDREDNLYVVDLTGRVQKFARDGTFLLAWQMPETDLGKPKGMACDREGNIMVVEPHYSRVNHHAPDGKLVAQWGSAGTNTGFFTVPRDVAVGTNGDVYVCEYSYRERVQAFDGKTKEFKFSFGGAGSENGRFNRPEGLAVDGRGRVLVADSCNHRVQIFSPRGEWLESFGQPGTGPGEMSYPYDIAVDRQGNIYVCEFGNSRIQIFDHQLRSREIIGGIGDRAGKFYNPWTLAFDSQDNLFVADGLNHRVQKLARKPSREEVSYLRAPDQRPHPPYNAHSP